MMKPPAQAATLAVTGLRKIYPGAQGGVHEASFTLAPGTFFTLLGPSGCGKTTTLRSIAGLERPDAGRIALGDRVFFDGQAGLEVPLDRRQIGMVFQSYAIWPHMTVLENVAFPLRVVRDRRFPRAEVAALVAGALETVGLAAFAARPATRLSGGQQQRVALARAIVREPRLLLLDEPLSNLDAALREEMRTELKRLQRQLGLTTVYVTHDQAEALELSDTIAVMQAGRIVQMGPPREIYLRPRNRFVASFVGATNLLDATAPEAVAAGAQGPATLRSGQVLQATYQEAARPGAAIALSIRPEALLPGPAQVGWNQLEATVETAGFLGHLNRYKLRLGDTPLHLTTGPESVLEPGAPITLQISPTNTLALQEDA